jgi:hypothetical protein
MYHSNSSPSDDDNDNPASTASCVSDGPCIRYHVACGTENEENCKRLRAKASSGTLSALREIDERKIVDESRHQGDMRSIARDKDVEYEIYCKLSRQAGDAEPVTSMAPEKENWVRYGMNINERAKLASLGDPRLGRREVPQKELDQYDMDRYQVLQEAARRLEHNTQKLSNAEYIRRIQVRQKEDGDDYAFEPTPTGLTRDEEIRAMDSLRTVDATNYSSAMRFSKQAASNWPKDSRNAVAEYRARQNSRAEILQVQHRRLCEADAEKSKEALLKEPSLSTTTLAGASYDKTSLVFDDWRSPTSNRYIPAPDLPCSPLRQSCPSESCLRRFGRLLFGGRRHTASRNSLNQDAKLDQGSGGEKGT